MRNYYPLIMGGAVVMLLTSQPLQAKTSSVEEEQSQFQSNDIVFSLETVEASSRLTQQFSNSQIPPSELELDAQQTFSKLSAKALETAIATEKLPLSDRLIAQTLTPPPAAPAEPSEVVVPQPEITIKDNGSNGISEPPNLEPQTSPQPYLPRAVAPPVGDMAISNIDASAGMIDLGTGAIVPRLVLRQAPAREVLAVLARYAGLNLVFTDDGQPTTGDQGAAPAIPSTVSLDLENESVQDVFNSVLMISGLSANRRGRTIFVGSNLPNGARNLISRTLRLNQVQAINAATFLATQGAGYQRVVIETEDVVDPVTQRVVRRVEKPAELKPLAVAEGEGGTSPLLLSGLTVAADDRLNSITLIGDPRQVQVATSLLTQLDARRRQVVVNVKVIDVNLMNIEDFNSSFSFGINDTFFVQDNGAAIVNFGNRQPPDATTTRSSIFSPAVVPLNTTFPVGNAILEPFFDIQNAPFGTVTPGPEQFTQNIVPYARPNFGTTNNPFQPGISDININQQTGAIEYEYSLPSLFQFPKRFLLNLQAQITNGNAKILTDPSLVVQEGQEATVKLTQKVLESVQTSVDPLSGVRTITPVLADSGLTLTVDIDKVDDNGFINLSVSPTVAAPGGNVEFDSGDGAINTLTLLSRRELSSGLVRLRDGQTLILSGIIQESDRTTISKVPILGDIPLLGALFRSTSNETQRTEVIILLTPQIMEDAQNSAFGYNYTPGQDAAEILKKQGFPVQTP